MPKTRQIQAAAEPQQELSIRSYGPAARNAIQSWLLQQRYRKHPGMDLLVGEPERTSENAFSFSLTLSTWSQLRELAQVIIIGSVAGHVVVNVIQNAHSVHGQPFSMPSLKLVPELGMLPSKPSLFVQQLKPWLHKYMELTYEAVLKTMPVAQGAAEPQTKQLTSYLLHVYAIADFNKLDDAVCAVRIEGVGSFDVRRLAKAEPGEANAIFDAIVRCTSRAELARKVVTLLLHLHGKLGTDTRFGSDYDKCTAGTRDELLALTKTIARKAPGRAYEPKQAQAAAEPQKPKPGPIPNLHIVTTLSTSENNGHATYQRVQDKLTASLNKFGFDPDNATVDIVTVSEGNADHEDEEEWRYVAEDIKFKGRPGQELVAFKSLLTHLMQHQDDLDIYIDHSWLHSIVDRFSHSLDQQLKHADDVVIGSYSAPAPAVEINVDFEPEHSTVQAAAEPASTVSIPTLIHFMTNISSDRIPDRYTDCVETTLKQHKFTAHVQVEAEDGDEYVEHPSFIVTVRDLQFHGPRSGVGAALKAWLTDLKKSRFSQALYEPLDIADILTSIAHRDEQVEAAAEPTANGETSFAFNIVAEAPGTNVLKYMKQHLRNGYDSLRCLDSWKKQPGGEFAVLLRGPINDVKKRFLEVVTQLLQTEGVKELAHRVIDEHASNSWLRVKPGASHAAVQEFLSACVRACRRETLKMYEHPAFGGHFDKDVDAHKLKPLFHAQAAAEPSETKRAYLDWLQKHAQIGAPKCTDMKLKFKGRDITLSQDNAWSRDRIQYSFSVERGTFIKLNVTTAPATKPAFSVYLGPDVAYVFGTGGMFEIGRTKTGPDLQRTVLAALQLIEKSINDLVQGHTKRDRTGQKPEFMFHEANFILTGKLKRKGILVFENWNTKLGQRKTWEVTAADLEDLVWSRGRADWFRPLLERAAAEWRNSSQETNNAL